MKKLDIDKELIGLILVVIGFISVVGIILYASFMVHILFGLFVFGLMSMLVGFALAEVK